MRRIKMRSIKMRNIILIVCLMLSPSLLAHNSLLSTSPESEAIMADSPEMLEFSFSDATYFVELEVQNHDGSAVPIDFTPSIQASSYFSFDLPNLEDGAYAVKWMVEGDDTHQVKGEFSFLVGAATDHTQQRQSVEDSHHNH